MNSKKSGHATGMAGEFHVMESLFRLGHEPALTLGNAKNIDILVATKEGNLRKISVKAVRGGGKWPVGKEDLSSRSDLVFVLLLYQDFHKVASVPEVWVMPAPDVESRKRPWIDGSALYYSHASLVPADLASFKNAWEHVA